jgi:hypothetical protein
MCHVRGSAFLLCIVFSGIATAVAAQEQRFWAFLEPTTVVTRCAESSAAAAQARTRLAGLNDRIENLKDVDPPAKAVEELHALLRTECFLPAAETERIPHPDSSLSLKRWWIDAGGLEWLDSFLELPRLGEVKNLKPHIVVPPDGRTTLNLEAHRNHALQNFLCPLTETTCGAATRGWRVRAEAYFDAHRSLGRNDGSISPDERPASGTAVISRECAEKLSSSVASEKYEIWRACIEERRPKRTALPLGEFRAPSDGWLVISGRRGHYSFCDTTRAYDLRSGTAFISDSCSDLVLRRNGSVDRDATNRDRVSRIAVGTVPVQNLHEALWMMLLRGESEEVQLSAAYFPLPDGLVPRLTIKRRPGNPDDVPSFTWMSTAQSSLTWQWTPASDSAFVGELTWPNSGDAAEDHAASLLNIAEEGFTEGCVLVSPLLADALHSSGTRRLNDVSTDAIKELAADFSQALEKWKELPRCQPRH